MAEEQRRQGGARRGGGLWGFTFLVLDLGLDVGDGVAALDLQRDGLPRQRLHEDLHLRRPVALASSSSVALLPSGRGEGFGGGGGGSGEERSGGLVVVGRLGHVVSLL